MACARARWAGPVRAGRARAGRACAWCAAAGPAHGLRAVHAAGLFTSLVGCLGRAMVRTVACLWAAAGSSSLVNGRVMPSTMSPSWLVKARWPVFSYTRAPYKAPACTWGRGWLSSPPQTGTVASPRMHMVSRLAKFPPTDGHRGKPTHADGVEAG
ncbi:hypothetical protein I3842_Q127900 [Carya illinoinensis]|uniref:Uncharacterized protein n=1 Tax=Carya illinoinensis TaxID=32201 RepID=A0A921ZYE0_CARIL|nr:hypothetical protein I3842_Q127900 [Carya illinoinensis]